MAKAKEVAAGGGYRVKVKKRGKARKSYGPKDSKPKAYQGQGR